MALNVTWNDSQDTNFSLDMPTLTEALTNSNQVLLLDGPVGTELSRRGFDVNRAGWSSRAIWEAPELLLEIHREYVAAGARIITANTFRTHARNLAECGKAAEAREWTLKAVDLAREAAGAENYVCGSLAPLGDCYDVEQTPCDEVLETAHAQMVDHLREAGVDGVLLETQVSLREMLIAATAVQEAGLPLLVSMATLSGQQLLDGTTIETAVRRLISFNPLAIGVNCLPVEEVPCALKQMRQATELPLMVYANAGRLRKDQQWELTGGADEDNHCALAAGWVELGVRILGGCCGTRPALIAKFSQVLTARNK